ncbi:EF-P 5-aminopentanol modification-associated protein YfmF [Leuconostoc fallax]|uniref:Peptidase M16 C-terminal domain-containing protein n=1 Tax=Leuconostoc fallax TaxID=1251 RepID=A0A4R5NAV0_9LACO|nr:pitrilysin family protein [Leuconostoc fallax]MBU7455081.1 insulinase family protein [Leuconostoc fallax]TDG69646.1 hypothetical protein C5L23_001108 [Leuconostoc fallax]
MKKIQLSDGVNLVVIPTTQFKTLNISVDFTAQLATQNISERALLSYVQSASAKAYPNQQDVAQKLIDLYGARYQTDVMRFGQTHHVRFDLQLPAPSYIGEQTQLLASAFDFLGEMIFSPKVSENQFDQQIFAKEQQSLCNELASLRDDKRRYAMSQLKEITFAEEEMTLSSLGRATDVSQVTAASLYEAWHKMVMTDTISIIVLGDIQASHILELVSQWPLVSRKPKVVKPFYQPHLRESVISKSEGQSDINQSILTLAYHLNIPANDSRRFTALILNALFGGSPLSKLFTNVREQQSLAYSIFSSWQQDTGYLTVLAGVDKAQVQSADEMIQQQLQDIQAGNIDLDVLEAIKASTINDYLSQQDSPAHQLEKNFARLLTGRQTTAEQWINYVQNVTPQMVQQLSQEVILQNRFVLLPEG